MVNYESGLLGISETTSDMRDLHERKATDTRAADAINLFCYQVRKAIGGFAAALGGVDMLVFAGGIGENDPKVRAQICAGLVFLGIELDSARNVAGHDLISAGHVRVRVIRTNEELVIAQAVCKMLKKNEKTTRSPLAIGANSR
jgi:acetate kinase